MKHILLLLLLSGCSLNYTSANFIKDRSVQLSNYESLYSADILINSHDCTLLAATKENKTAFYNDCMKDTSDNTVKTAAKIWRIRKLFKQLASLSLEGKSTEVKTTKETIDKEIKELK